MGMRLLKKDEIDKQKVSEKRQAIDEGLKIARRVDSLRETYAQEEASLDKFRTKTVAKINEEIVKKSQEKERLEREVSKLERAREEAKRPLIEELTALQEIKKELQKEKESLEIQRTLTEEHEQIIKKKLKDVSEEWQRLLNDRERSQQLLANADALNQEARARLKTAQKTEDEAVYLKRDTESALKQREKSISMTEERQKKRDTEQDKREKSLNARETRLRDREEVLERNIKKYGRRK